MAPEDAASSRLTLVNDARVELDSHRVADDLAEESGRVPTLVLWCAVLHAGCLLHLEFLKGSVLRRWLLKRAKVGVFIRGRTGEQGTADAPHLASSAHIPFRYISGMLQIAFTPANMHYPTTST